MSMGMCLVLLALGAALDGQGSVPDTRARIDRVAQPLVERGVAVGVVVGVLEREDARCLAYGETGLGSGVLPDDDTVYEIGSITKVFTALLLADAVERGAVGLDDPVQKYLPAAVTLPVKGAPITLAHLASHTSGLPRLPPNLKPADDANPYADYSVEDLYASLRALRLEHAPGRYEYSNYGAGLLGHVLGLRAHRPYADLLVERVLDPLGMKDTRIVLTPEQRRRLAPPYDADRRPARNWDLGALAGAGALRSTCRDMLRFARAALDADGPLARLMARTQAQRLGIEGGLGVGLGWHVAADQQTRWHDGGTGGYRAWLAVVPGLKLGVVALSNTASDAVLRFGEDATRAAAGLEVALAPVRTAIDLPAPVLARYVGRYALTPDFALEVSLERGQLMVQATGQGKYPVYPSAPGEFFYRVVDAQLSFVADAGGRVSKIVLHQGGRDMEGARTR